MISIKSTTISKHASLHYYHFPHFNENQMLLLKSFNAINESIVEEKLVIDVIKERKNKFSNLQIANK